MALTVVDSDVLIDVLRGKESVAQRVAELLRLRSYATTCISVFEISSGDFAREKERRFAEYLLRPRFVLPLNSAAAERAAQARRRLESRGLSIGTADYLIAGICLSRELPLMTRNRAHFERIDGLRLAKFT